MTVGKVNPSAFVAQEFATTWQWRIDTDPELAASLGQLPLRRSSHALDPRSLDSFNQRLEWVSRALHRIRTGVSPEQYKADLTKDEKLSYDLYVGQLEEYVTYTQKFRTFLCCVNRLEGPQSDLPLYARYLKVKTLSDRQFYRDFLNAIPKQIEEVKALLNCGLTEKRTPPQVSLDGVVEQLRGMIKMELVVFSKPIEGCFTLPDEESLKEECENLINGPVMDAFAGLADFLEKDYIPNLRTEISATKAYPDGDSYYEACLKFHTTTSMTPQEVHQLGLDEVKRVREAMEAIATDAGYEGKLEEYLLYLRNAPEFEPKSAAALLGHFRDIVGRISPALLNIIHLKTLPRQPVEITETPAASASMAPAAYYLAGSTNPTSPRPGMFYVNTSELSTRRTYECEALALHEAIPGHHTQAAIQGENPLPDFRRFCEDRRYFEAPCRFPFYTGYIEGWGLHSETLGKELGLYKNPTDQIGQLSMEALRSCRLVVDTGMHSLGWSQDEALEFMLKNTAMGEHDAVTEVIRYITWPGQATAYKVGERFIRKMRNLAETELKDHFDPRDFYDVVLLCGAVPLDVLEGLVREYIDATQKDKLPASNPTSTQSLVEEMTFANWCKCCVVPGSCRTYSP